MADKKSYEDLQRENEELKQRIRELESKSKIEQNGAYGYVRDKTEFSLPELPPLSPVEHLNKEQVNRYGRQLIMGEIGTTGQKKIMGKSVLIVGAGGLGSSAALYIAGSGIGRLGIVDFDTVEMSNLHRQVIHKESSIGVPKSISARNAVLQFNSSIECIAYVLPFTSEHAMSVIKPYDIVLDCSDNVATRYLLNDACVLLKKPLVSGAALRMDGQVTVYNYNGGPCYRCLFPSPPPPDTVTDCANGGVLGVVPGIIGCIQALEAIKIAAETGNVLSQKLLLFDAMSPRYQLIKLRPRNSSCAVCGDHPTITEPIDYVAFCGSSYDDKPSTRRILDDSSSSLTCKEYKEKILDSHEPHLLLDVREELQYEICSLPNSTNIPLRILAEKVDEIKHLISDKPNATIYCLCRRGNDSQKAVQLLSEKGLPNAKNITGGLQSWAKDIDTDFPIY